MTERDPQLAPGLVGVIAQDTARFSMFGASLTGLTVPPGTAIKWQIGHDVAANTNELVRSMLATDGLDWLWILGDDHVFAPDLLLRLLKHNVDIVTSFCLTRTPPYKPVAFTGFTDDMHRYRLNPDDHRFGGVIPIHSAGSAGMLIRRSVFEQLEDPWFEAGKVTSQEMGEDVYFCDKARDAGASLFCDLDAPLGHCTTATVWPVSTADGWTYGFGFSGGLKITLPVGAWEEAEALLAGGVQ